MSNAHIFADTEDAAERYLLGQMSESDRDAYEQHFFACVECAQEVKATARFIENCRGVLGGGAATAAPSVTRFEPRPWFRQRTAIVLTGALAATLALSVYQNMVTIPSLANALVPRAVTALSLAGSTSRGSGARTIVAPRDQPFVLYVDIPPGAFDTYDCTIMARDGRTVLGPMPVPAAQTQDPVPLLITPGRLTPADYTLVTTGRPRRAGDQPVEVARFPFTLRFAD